MLPNNACATHLSTLKRHHSTVSIYKHTPVPLQDVLKLNGIPAKLHFNHLSVKKSHLKHVQLTAIAIAIFFLPFSIKAQNHPTIKYTKNWPDRIWIEVSCQTVCNKISLNAFFVWSRQPHLVKMIYRAHGELYWMSVVFMEKGLVQSEWRFFDASVQSKLCRHYITLTSS